MSSMKNTLCEAAPKILSKVATGAMSKVAANGLTTGIEKTKEIVGRLLRQNDSDKSPEPVIKIDSVPDITKVDTLNCHLEQLLSLLRDEVEVKTIVIWGPLGVGKTTIMQNLNNHEEVAKLFPMVIWIKVSEERTMEKLQMEIASRLKLNLQDTDVARRISDKLNGTRYLILLDDVRGVIKHDELKGIGIPGDKLKGSKMVLTTENRKFCFYVEPDREIEVKKLTEREAWKMFKQIAADQIEKNPDIETEAKRVANYCGRLPLVIKIVASYFKFKDTVIEWRHGLRELRRGLTVEIPHLTQIHELLKCCYDDLDEDKKRCFLYAALHPADKMISSDYLAMCWAAENFHGNTVGYQRFRNAYNEGYDTLRHLTDVSLLQADKRKEHVEVNKVVRQVALHISSQDHAGKFLIGDQTESSTALQNNNWKQVIRIFMIDANLKDLPIYPRYNELLSLLLQKNPDLDEIPPFYFKRMRKLLVLNLCETAITSLPDSVEKLTKLRALFLNNCESFSTLPPQIEQLQHLEVLDIRGCKVIFIPSSIGKLDELRCFRVSYYKSASGNGYSEVISKLSKLEELVIDVISYDQWCTEARNVIIEVASLRNLTSLKMCFPNPDCLRTLTDRSEVYRQLTWFQFSIGFQTSHPQILDYFSHSIQKYLGFNCGQHQIESTIFNRFPDTGALELISHTEIRCLSDFMQASGLKRVVGCLVEDCSNMDTIIKGNNAGGTKILPSLQQLHLRGLPHLKSIFVGSLSQGSLSALQTIVVKHCPMLTEISSNGLIQQLPRLSKLRIESCDEIKELIMDSGGSGSMTSLEVLELVDMEKLESICAEESLKWPKLKELQIVNCTELKKLPFNKENADGLKLIRGQQAWWNNLPNNEFKMHCQSIGILRF